MCTTQADMRAMCARARYNRDDVSKIPLRRVVSPSVGGSSRHREDLKTRRLSWALDTGPDGRGPGGSDNSRLTSYQPTGADPTTGRAGCSRGRPRRLHHEVNKASNERRMIAGSTRPREGHAAFLGGGSSLGVQVEDHLHVIGDETDQHNRLPRRHARRADADDR